MAHWLKTTLRVTSLADNVKFLKTHFGFEVLHETPTSAALTILLPGQKKPDSLTHFDGQVVELLEVKPR